MNEFRTELTENILPFWMSKMQDVIHGGFYGRIGGNNMLYPYSNKGAILNARILWTFSAAYRLLQDAAYIETAQRAFDYIRLYFIDKKNGGAYWESDYLGQPVNTKKQTYVQGFMLYGFSEFYRATGNPIALELSKEFFYLLENKCKDKAAGGYFEAFTEDWRTIKDMRLSKKDANEKKTMNTHLHILEPYTNLCRIWDNAQLKQAQKDLISIFTDKIISKDTFHLNLFFDENWESKSPLISYGHDIEAAWLLYEAAVVLGDKKIEDNVRAVSIKIANAVSEGLADDGSLLYEKEGCHIDADRHWWVQAEAVVGYMYLYRMTNDDRYMQRSQDTWRYIRKQIIDTKSGEWVWSRKSDGTINTAEDKAGFWKCPYHNSRMCMEMMNINDFL